jgi:hypothetical protein
MVIFFYYLFVRKEAYLYVLYLIFLTQIKMTSKITFFSRKSRAYKNFCEQGERSFSCLKRIKSDIRTTMEQIRRSPLSDINVHSDIILSLK